MSMDVLVVIGVGGMGQAVARRQGPGKVVLLADFNEALLKSLADTLRGDGHAVHTRKVDVSSRESVAALAETAAGLGNVTQVVHTAGLSPAQAPSAAILAVDLLGVALVLEEFGQVIAPGGAGVVISSSSAHMMPPLTPVQEEALINTPADELLDLPFATPRPTPTRAAPTASPSRPTSCASGSRAWSGAGVAHGSTPEPGRHFDADGTAGAGRGVRRLHARDGRGLRAGGSAPPTTSPTASRSCSARRRPSSPAPTSSSTAARWRPYARDGSSSPPETGTRDRERSNRTGDRGRAKGVAGYTSGSGEHSLVVESRSRDR